MSRYTKDFLMRTALSVAILFISFFLHGWILYANELPNGTAENMAQSVLVGLLGLDTLLIGIVWFAD